MRRALAGLAVVVLLCGSALAQSSSALINEALDQQFKLDISKKTPLPQIIQQITNETGVPIQATPDVWQLLPWGEQTAIAAKIENQTLRQALEAICRKLGLTFELQDEAVELRPMAALKRMGRRATISELEVLDLLASTPLGAEKSEMPLKQLLNLIDSKLSELKSPFAVENRYPDDVTVPLARNATLKDALESVAANTPATWYPWGKTIVVVNKEEPIRNLLARTISVRFPDVDISQVLSELSTRAGVAFTIEPGAIQRIPPESRKVNLVLTNATIQQALETLAGFTGLSYTVNGKGVYIWNESRGGGSSRREPLYGILTLENGMQVLIPQSQVPADLKQYLKHKVDERFASMRKDMKAEGFVPTTQPASTTRPAEENQ